MFPFKNHAENEAGRLVPDLFLFFKKVLSGHSNWSAAWFQNMSIVLKLAYNKNKFHKTLGFIDPEIYSILCF